jgi:hypothetical protein
MMKKLENCDILIQKIRQIFLDNSTGILYYQLYIKLKVQNLTAYF